MGGYMKNKWYISAQNVILLYCCSPRIRTHQYSIDKTIKDWGMSEMACSIYDDLVEMSNNRTPRCILCSKNILSESELITLRTIGRLGGLAICVEFLEKIGFSKNSEPSDGIRYFTL